MNPLTQLNFAFFIAQNIGTKYRIYIFIFLEGEDEEEELEGEELELEEEEPIHSDLAHSQQLGK